MAGIIPGFLITWVGMPKHADPATLDPAIMNNLAVIYLPCTAIFHGLAISMLLFYRINRGAHDDNLRKIREAAATAAAAREGAAAGETPVTQASSL